MNTRNPITALFAFLCITFSDISAAHEEFVVAFSQDTLANDWRLAQVEAVRTELKRNPHVRFEVTDARGNTALQILQIEDLAASGVDVLITSPREKKALTPAISRVHRSGIPVILLDRGIEGDDYTAFIRPSNKPIARSAAGILADRLQGKGSILMLKGVPGAGPTLLRTEGFMEVIQDYPGIHIIRRTANFLRADAIRAVEDVLAAGQRFDAIYAQSDSMAAGARLALRRAGIDPASLPTVGIDYIREARQAIRRGEQLASFTYETGGREGARLALDILAGKTVEKEIILQSTRVTADNVEQVEPIF